MVLLLVTILFAAVTVVAYTMSLEWQWLRFFVAATVILLVVSVLRLFVRTYKEPVAGSAAEPTPAESPEAEAGSPA